MEKNTVETTEDRAFARREKVRALGQERAERERRQREAAHAESSRKEREKADAAERQQYGAAEWAMVNAWQRFAARLAVGVEKDSPSLASAIRIVLAQSLAGTDEAFPRAEWSTGLGLDTLSAERREDLTLAAKKEIENIALSAIPAHELLRLRLCCGNDPQSMLTMWSTWRRAPRAGR